MATNVIPIAIVEDEAGLREEFAFQLRHLGFAVEAFEQAAALYRRLTVQKFDVVVLDIGLPGEDGLSVCRHLRAHDRHLGIVFLTARAMRDDRLTGLHAGADAYFTKPGDIDELALVLKRLAGRAQDARAEAQPLSPAASGRKVLAMAGWQLEAGSDFLEAPGGGRVRLSTNELRLLRALLETPGEVVVVQQLARALGLLPDEYDKHRLEVVVSRLREKVLRETGLPLPLQTRRGVGYVFEA